MFRTGILTLILLQTSQSLSLGRLQNDKPILTEESYGMNLARHQTPEYSDEVMSRDAQFMSTTFSFSEPSSFFRSSQIDLSRCRKDRQCTSKKKMNVQYSYFKFNLVFSRVAADINYRSIDGSCNNMLNPQWGQASLPFKRLLPRKHSLVECGAASNQLPNPRLVSRLLIHRGDFDVHSEMSMMTMVWGQVVDHDIEITPPRKTPEGDFLDCCAEENRDASDCCPIMAPTGDPFYGRNGRPLCMPFLRLD